MHTLGDPPLSLYPSSWSLGILIALVDLKGRTSSTTESFPLSASETVDWLRFSVVTDSEEVLKGAADGAALRNGFRITGMSNGRRRRVEGKDKGRMSTGRKAEGCLLCGNQ